MQTKLFYGLKGAEPGGGGGTEGREGRGEEGWGIAEVRGEGRGR